MTTAIQWWPNAAAAGFTDKDFETFKGPGVRLELLASSGRVIVLGGVLDAGQAMLATQEIAPDEVSEAGSLRWLKVPIEQLWSVIADLLPQPPVLTSALVPSAEIPGQERSQEQLSTAAPQATVELSVEAWPTATGAARIWASRWAVLDDQLFELRQRQGEWVGIPRSEGSLAAELQWALVGAMDVVASQPSGD